MRNDKNKTEYTSEDYQAIARKHQMALRSNKNIFLRTGLFVAAAIIIMVLIVLAWFVANNRTDAISSTISAIDNRYVIVPGKDSDNIGFWERGNKGLEFNLSDSMKVNADSNFRNTTETGRLSPGASGKLVFTVKPIAKDLNGVIIEIEENVQFRKDDKGNVVLGSDDQDKHRNLMKGHILFFLEKNGRYYSNWIGPDSSGKYSFTISKDQFIPQDGTETTKSVTCTVYWVWPQEFHNMVYTGGGTYYRNIFETQESAGYSQLITDMNYNLNKYIMNTRAGITVSQDMSGENYSYCTQQYNLADENIGANVDFIQVRFNTREAVMGGNS